MKLFCRCVEPWIFQNNLHSRVVEIDGSAYTRQVRSNVECPNCCHTKYYWYDADYENMMFDLKRMNQC